MRKKLENIKDLARYKRRREILHCSALYYSYLTKYNLTIHDLKQSDFGIVLKTFNVLMLKEALVKGTQFRFPYKAGFFRCERKIYDKPFTRFMRIDIYNKTGEKVFRAPFNVIDNYRYFAERKGMASEFVARSAIFVPFKNTLEILRKATTTTNFGKNYSQYSIERKDSAL